MMMFLGLKSLRLQPSEALRSELSECERRSSERDARHEASIAALKVQAGLVGLVGGMIPAVGVLIYFLLSNG